MIPTNYTAEIIQAAHAALDLCYDLGDGWMKGGIMLYDLAEEGARQLTLLEACLPETDQKRRALMAAMDQANDRYGRNTVRPAAMGNENAFWRMRRGLMSPYYTTRLSDARVAYCL